MGRDEKFLVLILASSLGCAAIGMVSRSLVLSSTPIYFWWILTAIVVILMLLIVGLFASWLWG
jgi:hypothetical protein